jgi:SAM-dependent methyltransferase
MNQQLKLNIGAGMTRIPGFVNIDISERADIQIDLGKERLPFDDNSVDLVFSYHTLEHVSEYLFALGQIYRVLRHGGQFLLGVPYVTSTEFNLINPYHKHNFSEYSFDFFLPSKRLGGAASDDSIIFEKIFHRFHYMKEFEMLDEPMRTWCRRHLFNVVKKIDFGLIAIKDINSPIAKGSHIEPDMIKEFDNLLSMRVLYK